MNICGVLANYKVKKPQKYKQLPNPTLLLISFQHIPSGVWQSFLCLMLFLSQPCILSQLGTSKDRPRPGPLVAT